MNPEKELELLLKARTPIIYVRTFEEDRLETFLKGIVTKINKTGKACFANAAFELFRNEFPDQMGILSSLLTEKKNKVYIDLNQIDETTERALGEVCFKKLLDNVENKKKLGSWTQDKGLLIVRNGAPTQIVGNNNPRQDNSASSQVPRLLKHLSKLEAEENHLVVAYDLHMMCNPLEIPTVDRHLKDLARNYRNKSGDFRKWPFNTLILVSSIYEVPRHMEKDIELVEFPPPSDDELSDILDARIKNFQEDGGENIRERANQLSTKKDLMELLCRAGQGLTGTEFQLAVNKMMMDDVIIGNDCADHILTEKQQIIQKNEILEYYPPTITHKNVGGLESFREWLNKRYHIIKDKAWENEEIGIPMPKGVLIVGVSGGGKSLMAKATAGAWKMPLLRLDMGKAFSKYVGESERRIRDALRLTENMSPCILWLDEIEKGLAGSGGGGDSGVGARVLGNFLTWMQEKEKPVFMIATANSIDLFVTRFPEFLRKGRFDNIFFVDLPNPAERKAILEIHLNRYVGHISDNDAILSKVDLTDKLNKELDMVLYSAQDQHQDNLVAVTEHFTGAEIEYYINEIAINAFVSSESSRYIIDYDSIKNFFQDETVKPMHSRIQDADGNIPEATRRLDKTRTQAREYAVNAGRDTEPIEN